MTPIESIGGVIAIAQAIVGTCKAIDICVTAIKDSQETLDRWNVTIKSLQHISQQFEAVLRERKATQPRQDFLEGTHYGVISTHLERFNRDLRKLESNISNTNHANRASTSRVSFRNKVKLALAMDWRENEQLFKWIDRHIMFLQINRDLIRGVNDDNMNQVQRALGTGHASWKPAPTPEALDEPRVELDDWLSTAEGFVRHIAIQELGPSDGATLTPTDVDWDLMPDTTEMVSSSTVSLVEQELRLRATIQQVDHLEASNIPVIASNVQLEVIRLSNELNQAKGLTPSFEETFRLQERYVNLLLKSIEKHPVFAVRAEAYVRENITPNLDQHDPDLRDIWWSVGRMFYTMESWAQATVWLRRALLDGYAQVDRDGNHAEIEQISKMICKIYEREGRPQFAIALGKYLEHHVGYDPTKVPGDLEKAIEWCSDKGFEVHTEGDELVFTHLKNDKGRSVLHEAALDTEVKESIIPLLLRDDLLALRNSSGDTALLLAIGKSNTAVIRSLLRTPSLIHVRDREGRTPLHRCCDHKILSLLLEALDGSMHQTSLTHADPDSHDASSLIDINSRDAYGKTALFMACAQGNLRMMRKLLDAGADVTSADRTGVCPLLACSSCTGISLARREEMILRLRAKGADPDQEDIDENTAKKELRRLFSSSRAVNKFLSLNPAAELERLEKKARAERRGSDATANVEATEIGRRVCKMAGSLNTTTSDPGQDRGWIPLMCAAEAGDIDALTELLTDPSDIDIDARDYDGCTSLALAAQNGHTVVVERLLLHDANPNLGDLEQVTPLWKAARYGHTSVVQLLLANTRLLDVNPRPAYLHEYKWDTPLSIALKEGHRDTAELLSRADGINPCLKTDLFDDGDRNISILGFAIHGVFEDVALALLDKCDFEVADSGDGTYDDHDSKDTVEPTSKILILAVASGCPRIVGEILTKHGADINAVHEYYAKEPLSRFEDSPLTAASRRGDLNTVRLLLDMDDIRPDVSSKYGSTALILAARGGFVDVVKILIADGRIEVGCENHDGRTALSFAVESGSEAVTDELLATGAANPNGQDSQGRTALIWAADPHLRYRHGGWQSHEGVIRKLLARSQIDVNSKNASGGTALFYAAKNGALRLVVALLEQPNIDPMAGPRNISPLAAAASNGHADVVQALLSIGRVDVNAVIAGWDQRTALMAAVEYGRVEYESATQVLLSTAGIDVNFQDRDGTTALMLAAAGGTSGMVKLILTAGGNPNVQDHNGNTAINMAIFHGRDIEILKVLLEDPGVEPDRPNNVGRTALSLAAEAGKIEYVNALLAREDVNPDARDILGRGPLSWVFGESGLEWQSEEWKAVLRRLLSIPAVDPNAEDHNGLTPLLLAIMSDHGHEYVEVLLSRPDLDVNRPRAQGHESPLDTAKQTGNMETMALLRARGASNPAHSAPSHCLDENPVVEEGDLSGECSMAGGTRRRRRKQQRSRRSSSQGSETSSGESDFDSYELLTLDIVGNLKLNHLRLGEHHLYLGKQQAYVGEWAESTAGLCSTCLDIGLGSAFWKRHTRYAGRVIADLGRVDETWKKRSCPLCRLFASVYPRTSLEEGHKLVSFSTTQSWLCHHSLIRFHQFRRFVDTMVLSVVAADSVVADELEPSQDCKDRDVRREKDVVKAAFSSGLIGRLGGNGPYKGSVTIPRLTTEISDWSVARDWITLCRKNHLGECNPRKAAPVPHFFLIECSTRQIVEQNESQSKGPPPYVALSYVWGQSQGSQQPPPRQKQQEILEGKGGGIVEAAIEDAIRVTLELGYGYLWVDRYCIVQTGDEAVKQEQLQHMHLVYANAEVTLIAAAGEDSSAGLPGAPGRPRNQQPGALIQGHAMVCIPPDPSLHILSRSTWATRGWTYQEGLLARRRLYFSEFEMSYECRHMLCREAIRLPIGLEQRLSGHKPRFMEPFWMYQPYKVPGMDSSQTGVGLFDLLTAYTKRKLSLPSDTLNAMLGLFSLLAQHKTRPIYHICGVPILRLDDPQEYGRRKSPDPAASSNNDNTDVAAIEGLGGFVDGLCWRLEQPAHRRPGFPSWSWTGWEGVVAGMDKISAAIKQPNEFSIDVSIIPGNQDSGVAVPWSCCYDHLRMVDDSNPDIRSGQQHILEITASAVTVRFRTGEYDGRPNTWIGTVCAGNGVWQGEFFLTSKDILPSSLLQEPWTGIVLGNSESRKHTNLHDTTVLVIQEQKYKQSQGNTQNRKYCERAGLLRLTHCTLEGSMLKQETWRLR
ncbi:hypothetical protein FGADI_11008 [Fusarium gaditjirri]|uniref:Heterokaryon incompatibility domain-containing protein n=1 Tax=Fusarium gaditjirri TaxID=282569 RepID=A0A8H4SW44_9HYPO|nr:hypothetical protein FGADI_11008 [Fusarium gaditjirri]